MKIVKISIARSWNTRYKKSNKKLY